MKVAFISMREYVKALHLGERQKMLIISDMQLELEKKMCRKREAMRLHPLTDHVVVRRREAEEEHQGGIIIPDTVKDKPQEGDILAVGPSKMRDDGHRQPMVVAVGDTVLFGKYAGAEITLDHEDLLVMRESDILGVLKS